MLFAQRIILVEGIAEAVLLPVLARRCVFRDDLAKQREFHAVTIINVGSVDFAPYIRLLLGAIDGLTVMDTWSSSPTAIRTIEGAGKNSDDDEKAAQPAGRTLAASRGNSAPEPG